MPLCPAKACGGVTQQPADTTINGVLPCVLGLTVTGSKQLQLENLLHTI